MKADKIYVEIPGELGWRQYPLAELLRLRRAGQLRDARYQDDHGQWRPLDELLDAGGHPMAGHAVSAAATADPRPLAKWRWPVVVGGVVVLIAFFGLRPMLRHGQMKEQAARDGSDVEPALGVESVVKSGGVVPGMTFEQVRRGVGEPRARKATADGSVERWIYRSQVVVFRNGKVTEVEAPP